MSTRIDAAKIAPEAYKALIQLEGHVRKSGLDHRLVDLVYLRVSQMNGCAFCIDMHSRELRAHGETEQRMHLLPVFREVASFYTPRERAALAWAETVTAVGETHVPAEAFAEVSQQFEPREVVELTVAIGMINTWNRIGVAFQLAIAPAEPAAR